MKSIRVLLADDHSLMRAGIHALISGIDGIEVVARAANATEALKLISILRPDILLTDIGMPGMSGIELASRLAVDCPSIRVVFLTMHNDQEYVRRATAVGAAGYLLKNADEDELERALRAVGRGEKYFSPAVLDTVNLAASAATGTVDPPDDLTPRQREVLRMVAQGHSTKNIARRLGISIKTVESHRTHLMERLDIHDIAGLVRYAIRTELISPGP